MEYVCLRLTWEGGGEEAVWDYAALPPPVPSILVHECGHTHTHTHWLTLLAESLHFSLLALPLWKLALSWA